MQVINRINRWLDGFIILLVIAIIAIGIANWQTDKRKRQPEFDHMNVSSGFRTSVNGKMDALASCQTLASLTAYYSACAGDEPSDSTAPLTCPEARPDTVSREPTLRSAVSILSKLYTSRYKSGQCDQVIADSDVAKQIPDKAPGK